MTEQKLISVKDFTPEELRKWQLKLLEILVYFKEFCEAHNLRFMLAAGTCLGAVRHKGFIPWDDDLDVQMPREDYDKMIELWNKEADTSRFVCSVTNETGCSRFPMAVIRSVGTTCIYNHSVNDDICQGLKIDVEFLDGVPDNRIVRMYNMVLAFILALFRAQRVPERASKLKTTVARILLWLFHSMRTRWRISVFCEKQIKKYRFGEQEYVRYLACALRPSKSFINQEYLDFEGYKMPVPAGYDAVLRAAYGDYMKLPPKEARKPATDNLVFYDLDKSYLNYKGEYYCNDESKIQK